MNLRAHARDLKEETGKSPSPWPEILGGLALAIAILLVIGLFLVGLRAGAVFSALAAWFLILLGVYRWVRAERAWLRALGTIVVSALVALLELAVGAGLVVSGRGGLITYLVLAVVAAIVAIVVKYKRLLANR
jgi:hypothetical protein